MALTEYQRKRDFAKTPEPAGGAVRPNASPKLSFVIQKHAARRLHYDFRLELDGVLKSWAVPKGPSTDPGEKRLAVHVEDHPLEYGGFEGVIPEKQYGAGASMIWDRGSWTPLDPDPQAAYAKGNLKFALDGQKLHGKWVLVRMGGKHAGRNHENWLLIKERDDAAMPGSGDAIVADNPKSAATGRTIDEIAADRDRIWGPNGEERPADARRAAPHADPSRISGRQKRADAGRPAAAAGVCGGQRRRTGRIGCTRSNTTAIACWRGSAAGRCGCRPATASTGPRNFRRSPARFAELPVDSRADRRRAGPSRSGRHHRFRPSAGRDRRPGGPRRWCFTPSTCCISTAGI